MNKISLLQFLVLAGLLDEIQLKKIIENAEFFGLAPVELLLANQYLSTNLILLASSLLSDVTEGLVSLEFAVQTLSEYDPDSNTQAEEELDKLGAILVEAGIISPEQLAAALIDSDKLQQRLGQRLLLRGFIEAPELERCLGLQASRRKSMADANLKSAVESFFRTLKTACGSPLSIAGLG